MNFFPTSSNPHLHHYHLPTPPLLSLFLLPPPLHPFLYPSPPLIPGGDLLLSHHPEWGQLSAEVQHTQFQRKAPFWDHHLLPRSAVPLLLLQHRPNHVCGTNTGIYSLHQCAMGGPNNFWQFVAGNPINMTFLSSCNGQPTKIWIMKFCESILFSVFHRKCKTTTHFCSRFMRRFWTVSDMVCLQLCLN